MQGISEVMKRVEERGQVLRCNGPWLRCIVIVVYVVRVQDSEDAEGQRCHPSHSRALMHRFLCQDDALFCLRFTYPCRIFGIHLMRVVAMARSPLRCSASLRCLSPFHRPSLRRQDRIVTRSMNDVMMEDEKTSSQKLVENTIGFLREDLKHLFDDQGIDTSRYHHIRDTSIWQCCGLQL